mgnify:CR=1 FL=1
MVLSSYSLRTWRRKYQKKDKEDIFHRKLWTYYVSEVMRIKKPLIEANEAYNKASKAYNEVKKTYKEALEMSTGEDIEKNRLVKENLERMKTEQDKKADLSSTAATAFQKKLKDWKLPREGSERDAAYRQVYRDKKLNYNPPTRTPWSIDDIIAILHKLRTAKEKEEKDKIAAAEAVSEEVETEEEEEEEEEEEAFRGASEGSITATPLALALGLLDNSNREEEEEEEEGKEEEKGEEAEKMPGAAMEEEEEEEEKEQEEEAGQEKEEEEIEDANRATAAANSALEAENALDLKAGNAQYTELHRFDRSFSDAVAPENMSLGLHEKNSSVAAFADTYATSAAAGDRYNMEMFSDDCLNAAEMDELDKAFPSEKRESSAVSLSHEKASVLEELDAFVSTVQYMSRN